MTAVTSAASRITRRWRALLGGLLACAAALFVLQPAQAQLRVDISGVGATQYPIAIADFSGDPQGRLTTEVVANDLSRSGQFQLINTAGAALQAESEIDHEMWRNRGADYIAFGSVSQTAGQYRIDYRLVDTVRKTELDAVAFTGNEGEMRRIAHQIADRIYERITGVRGDLMRDAPHLASDR